MKAVVGTNSLEELFSVIFRIGQPFVTLVVLEKVIVAGFHSLLTILAQWHSILADLFRDMTEKAMCLCSD